MDRTGRLSQQLRAHQLLDIIQNEPDAGILGVKEGDDLDDEDVRQRALWAVGRRLKPCFSDSNLVEIDDSRIERSETADEKGRPRFCYVFRKVDSPQSPVGAPAFPAVSRVPRGDSNTAIPEPRSAADDVCDNRSLTTPAGVAGNCGTLRGIGGNTRDQCGGDDWGEV